jgi:hypothetical protein
VLLPNDAISLYQIHLTLSDAVLVAIIGVASGAVGSLIAPWVNWGIDQRRLRLERRVKRITEWRQFIDQFDFGQQHFRTTTVYAAMRPYMSEEVIKRFESQRTFYVPPDGLEEEDLFRQWASDEVSKIERAWKLV